MSKKTVIEYLLLTSITLGVIACFVYLFQNYRLNVAKAQDNSLTFKIKLQGESYPSAKVYATVVIYNTKGKLSELINVPFTFQTDKLYWGTISFGPGFNYNDMYAFYIKPQAYFGRLFCSESTDGKSCTQPLLILKQNGTVIDLSTKFFSGGDIYPANGKVDAYDISRIISNLGKSIDPSTDINNDGITNSIDYLLALYSLGNNVQDDVLTLNNPSITPSITPSVAVVTPSLTPIMITSTPAPTSITPTTTPSPIPTIVTPTSTPATPTAPTSAGICRVTDPWGSSSDMKVGDVQCSCVMGICAQATCSSCNSSTPCECHPNSIPSDAGSTLPCTNGGGIFMKKVPSC